MVRARMCGFLTVAVIASVISTAGAARAETVPAPDPSGGVIDQPALPGGQPDNEPSVPEGTFYPDSEEPVPTGWSTVRPEAPIGTGTFESSHPAETAIPYFPSGGRTTTYRGTDGEVPQDIAPAPQGVESVEEPAETAPASPSPEVPSASPSPTGTPEPSVQPETAEPTMSAQRSPAPAVPGLILGIIVLVAGVAIMGYRGPVYAAAARAEVRWFATGSGDRAPRLRGPFPVALVGAFGALAGVVMIGYALWGLSG
ncbi:hypothetical protein ACF044_01415 [Microbacterium sp. NPDC016588]